MLSKADLYETRISSADYDLRGMVAAYGFQRVLDMLMKYAPEKVECVERPTIPAMNENPAPQSITKGLRTFVRDPAATKRRNKLA